jgi:twitching motility protein PilT
MDIFDFINTAIARGASDLHMSANSPPLIRIDGSLEKIDNLADLNDSDIRDAMEQIATQEDIKIFNREHELDFSYALPDGTRLRCNAAQQRGYTNLAIRILSSRVPTIDELELPEIYKRLISRRSGLIVVSGPTGSGKSTTQAAMIQFLNTNRTRHIVTLEDPIEYLHVNIKSNIIQRELGRDTFSFAAALKHVLRHDPDVICLGEMRDPETARSVLSLADTGHLVLTTSHAPNAPQAVQRIIDLFPPEERYAAQVRLSSLLTAILCQKLVPRAKGSGRIAAVEIMLANSAVRSLIHTGGFHQLFNVIRTSQQEGMISLDDALVDLYSRKIITREMVLENCLEPADVKKVLGKIEEVRSSLPLDIDSYNRGNISYLTR